MKNEAKKLVWGSHIQAMLLFGYMNIFSSFVITNYHFEYVYNTMWPLCMLMLCATLEIFNAGRYCYQFVNIRRQQDCYQWKLHLNPQYRSKLFVMKHINIFGNNSKLSLICFLITLLLLTIYAVGFLIFEHESYRTYTITVGIITYLFTGCLDLYFTQFGKLFKFVDFWGISQQQKTGAFISIAIVFFLLIIIWFDFQYETILTLTNAVCSVLLIMFITQNVMVPFKTYKNYEKRKQMEQSGANTPQTKHVQLKNEPKKRNLLDTISDDQGYLLFMKHLYLEYAAENLLFLTVLFQFETFLLECNIIKEDNQLFDDKSYTIPSVVPISEFFQYDANDVKCIEEKVAESFIAIYEKFIQRHKAEFEINISYELGCQTQQCYMEIKKNGKIDDNFQNEEWVRLQQAARQVFGLLKGSYGRFKYYKIHKMPSTNLYLM